MQEFYNENPVGIDTKTDELVHELSGVKDAMVENLGIGCSSLTSARRKATAARL